MELMPFYLSFVLTAVFTPFVIGYSHRKKLLDYPKENSIHTKPVPMTGGMVIFSVFFILSFALGAVSNLMPLFFASLLLVLSGLYDDRKGLNAVQKILIQIMAGTILIAFGIAITRVSIPFGPSLEISRLSVPVTILWLVFIINLVNLLDGLDGLAAGLCSIVLIVIFLIANPSALSIQLAVLIGSLVAFLIFNFHPAKIFLGNSGSSFLGLAIGYFSMATSQKSKVIPILIIPLCILIVQVLDVAYAVFRRARNGLTVFKGDRGHIHHLVLDSLKSYKVTVLSFYLVSILLAIAILKLLL
jgi:UDP-GlcNAc:undecaprenyl-phosphate GlcNAc-1-phosphate transferase